MNDTGTSSMVYWGCTRERQSLRTCLYFSVKMELVTLTRGLVAASLYSVSQSGNNYRLTD